MIHGLRPSLFHTALSSRFLFVPLIELAVPMGSKFPLNMLLSSTHLLPHGLSSAQDWPVAPRSRLDRLDLPCSWACLFAPKTCGLRFGGKTSAAIYLPVRHRRIWKVSLQ